MMVIPRSINFTSTFLLIAGVDPGGGGGGALPLKLEKI